LKRVKKSVVYIVLLFYFKNKIANNRELSPTPTPPAGRGYTEHNDSFSSCVQLSHYRFGNRITIEL
jgi:hypothetical protein